MASFEEIVKTLQANNAAEAKRKKAADDLAIANENKKFDELKEALKKTSDENKKEQIKASIALIEETRAARKENEDNRTPLKKSIDEQKAALQIMAKNIEDNGGIAKDNKDFQRQELKVAREEFKLRREQATKRGAKEEINKEERAMMMKQGTLLQKISAGIGGIGASMKEKALAVGGGLMKILKGTLFAGLFMALSAFFQSEAYQKTIDFIFDELIPFMGELFTFLKDGVMRVFTAFKNTITIIKDAFTAFSEGDIAGGFSELGGLFSADGAIALGITAIIAPLAVFKLLKLGKGALFGTIGLLTKLFSGGGDIDLATKEVINKSGGGKKGVFTNMLKGKGGLFKALGKFTGLFAAGGLIAGAMNFFTDKAKADVDLTKKNLELEKKGLKLNKAGQVIDAKTGQFVSNERIAQAVPEAQKQPPLKTDAVPTKPAVQTAAAQTAQQTAETSSKQVGKQVGKSLGKAALKKIPVFGALFGLAFGAQRALAGDFSGAAMEVASGLAGAIPIVGTAASMGIDAALMAKDMGVFNKVQGKIEEEIGTRQNEIEKIQERIASGNLRGRNLRAQTTRLESLQEEVNALRNEQMQNAALREQSRMQQGQVIIDAKSDNSQKVDSTTQQVNNQMIGNPDPIVQAAVL